MREVARGLAAQSVTTSYCSYGYRYRKDTRISNSLGLVLDRCPGATLCPAMVGSRHLESAQQGNTGGPDNKQHTIDELHSMPSGLVEEIMRQVVKECANDNNHTPPHPRKDPWSAAAGGGILATLVH